MIDPETRKRLHDLKGVVTVGEGQKWIADTNTEKTSISVGVETKKPKFELKKKDIVPTVIEGVQTDVVETGKIWALGVYPLKALAYDQRMRPFPGGISGGHYKITAGTINPCKKNGVPVLFSNCHVMANSNDADIGDAIYQPGPYDGGTNADMVATLLGFERLKYIGENSSNCSVSKAITSILNFFTRLLGRSTKFQIYSSSQPVNYVDAAIASLVDKALSLDEIIKIGKIAGVGDADIGTGLQKSGRTTEYTTGKVIQRNVSTIVEYGAGKQAYFEGQFMAGPMCQGGDSGSAILDMNKNIVGLLFAGSDQVTIFNPIDLVINTLGIEF